MTNIPEPKPVANLVQWMDTHLYPGQEDHWDDTLFRAEILSVLRPEHRMLDLGAGAGVVSQMNFRGLASAVHGVDLDERVLQNPYLDEGRVSRGEAIPYEAESFDLVIADNVLEHLEDPASVFSEVSRVLKPGGHFLAKTPNKWHYMPIIARLTPLSFHRFVNRLRGRAAEDTCPTCYRVNTPRSIARFANRAHLQVRRMCLIEGRPEYLRFNPLAYTLGWIYERTVNALPFLACSRVLLMIVLQKEMNHRPDREQLVRGSSNVEASLTNMATGNRSLAIGSHGLT